MRRLNITAIVIALCEQEFIEICLKAIYPFVTRIYVISNYDTDYYGQPHLPDRTTDIVLGLDDPDKKIVLFVNRRIPDETIQRNWAMSSDRALYQVSHRRFSPHAHTLKEIHEHSPRTDFFWVIDADEIYDPQTIPAAIDFVSQTMWDAVFVRGHDFFKTWNYRISLASDHFWQIGFLRSGRYFYNRRRFYIPRPLGWVYHLSPVLAQRLIDLYCRQTRLPEDIAYFYHGAYVGDDKRILKKLASSSHAREINASEWFEKKWKAWHPDMTDFYFAPNSQAWASVDHIATADLPGIIRDAVWPKGWIEE